MIDIPDFVYSKDDAGQSLCPRCQKPIAQCTCPDIKPLPQKIKPQVKISPKVRLEMAGRRGKAVTLIEGLPANEEYLNALAKALKMAVGSGGTYYVKENAGNIELQGDHRDVIRIFLRTYSPA